MPGGSQEGVEKHRHKRRVQAKDGRQASQQRKPDPLGHVRDPYGDPGDDVAKQLPRTVRPQPVEDGEVDEDELAPFFEGDRGEEGIA